MSDYAIDTAARFGEIPFVDFTMDLVTGVFDSLTEAHITQMEEYADFVASLSRTLSNYINNTRDGVTFDQVSEFILNYELPSLDDDALATELGMLAAPDAASSPTVAEPLGGAANPATWWGGLINTIAPAVTELVDKLEDPSDEIAYKSLTDYNDAVLAGTDITARTIPNYQQIYDSIAALIASNKYAILQNMVKQGMMRLVVTDGKILTKVTFSTWNDSVSGSSTSFSNEVKNKIKNKRKNRFSLMGIFKHKRKRKSVRRRVTVNTAKSYQRDTSGTKVDIFGSVEINFKTDYAPLNG